MSLDRDRLPDPRAFFDREGLALKGSGKWRTTRCDFHDGSDSMRVNVESTERVAAAVREFVEHLLLGAA